MTDWYKFVSQNHYNNFKSFQNHTVEEFDFRLGAQSLCQFYGKSIYTFEVQTPRINCNAC